ncbi:basic salivary proline-rich protein 4-like [Choloepus didactylus]|uniref:basic salivary proline-rich protein 4-like n=1 Tax=Choloepus didactylus TaxID=27675 RepID=UPI00189E7DE6|nr:basic salivary proline-rich protein 4-like [Choloepus didactylus]
MGRGRSGKGGRPEPPVQWGRQEGDPGLALEPAGAAPTPVWPGPAAGLGAAGSSTVHGGRPCPRGWFQSLSSTPGPGGPGRGRARIQGAGSSRLRCGSPRSPPRSESAPPRAGVAGPRPTISSSSPPYPRRTAGSYYRPSTPSVPGGPAAGVEGEGRAIINPRPEIPPEGPGQACGCEGERGAQPGNQPAPPFLRARPPHHGNWAAGPTPARPAPLHILASRGGRVARAGPPLSGPTAEGAPKTSASASPPPLYLGPAPPLPRQPGRIFLGEGGEVEA